MNDHQPGSATPAVNFDKLVLRLDDAIQAMEESRPFARAGKLPRVLDTARRVLLQPEGCRIIEERAERLENNNLSFPIDAKLFHVVNRIENKLFPDRKVTKDIVDEALA